MATEQQFIEFLKTVMGCVEGPVGPASFESRSTQHRYVCEECWRLFREEEILAHLMTCRAGRD